MKHDWPVGRRWLYGGILFTLLLLLVGCSSETSSPADNGEASNNQTFKFTFNSNFPKATTGYEGEYLMIEKFAQRVEEESEGRITFDLHFSNALVGGDQILDALASGTIDFALTVPQYYGDIVPSTFVVNLPFWSESTEHALKLLKESEVGEILEQETEAYGAKTLIYGPTGEYGLMSNTPIYSIDDLKGLVFRSGGGLWTPWYEELGLASANVGVSEVYEAMQRGVIDGYPSPYRNIESFKWHEVTDYIIMPPILSSNYMVTYVSLQTWNKLPSDLQQIILDVAAEIEQETIEGAEYLTQETLNFAQEYGVEIITLPDEEVEKLKASSQIVWDNFAQMSENNARIVEILNRELGR